MGRWHQWHERCHHCGGLVKRRRVSRWSRWPMRQVLEVPQVGVSLLWVGREEQAVTSQAAAWMVRWPAAVLAPHVDVVSWHPHTGVSLTCDGACL